MTVYVQVQGELQRKRAPRLVAVGDPSYPEVETRVGRLPPLPASRDEVEALRRLHGETATVLAGADATEERVKSLGTDVTHLHLAVHGVPDERFPLDSALALSMPEGGAPDEGENGLLQAWEIFESLRLDADLVTLSACETGLGEELGREGIVGLTRAFQYAGARAVMSSLWSVSDTSTSELMKRFYGHLRAGATKDEALRAAQLELLSGPIPVGEGEDASRLDARHPFYWAASCSPATGTEPERQGSGHPPQPFSGA